MLKRTICTLIVFAMLFSFASHANAAPVDVGEISPDVYSGTLSSSTDLLFEFDNRAKDKERYTGAAYGGYNFDQETNGYWATAYNESHSDYKIVNSGGTLRVNVTESTDKSGTYGPWIKVTNTYGKLPGSNANSYEYYPLSFDPSGVQTVTIRFKLNNCSVPSDKIPEIVFEYYYTSGGSYACANDMKAVYTFRNGEYMTVSIPVSSKLTNADELKGFGFRFRHIKGSNGTIFIDHIYIGANAAFVMQDHQDNDFLSQSSTPIASGVTQSQIFLKNKTDGTQLAGYMATISPSAKVTFKASYASYYTAGSTVESRKTACLSMPFGRMVATDHAAAYEAATGDKVLLTTNANFFDTTTFQPRGYLVMEGNIVQTYSVHRGAPYFAVLKDGSFVMRPYGSPLGDVQEAFSGYQWLVRDGELVTTNDDVTLAPRTAIGLKADGSVVILAVDGRQEPYSAGLTIHEMGEMMYAAGCVNAMNMDGGGSTTFASRYNGTGELLLQNRPSDADGARLLPTCLLLVAEPCEHRLADQPYTIYPDGTHSQICASCGEEIRVSHSYENDVCVCGDARHLGEGLLFDFGGTDADKYRYTDLAYNYLNYDMTTNGTWGRGYWATDCTDTTTDFTVDNATGTLSVSVGQGHSGSEADGNIVYGPWLKITNGYGKYPSKTNNANSVHAPLYYDPADVEFVQIRFKTENCVVVSGAEPKIDFEYYYTLNGVYTGATDMSASYSYTEGQYVTVTIPASELLRQADVLRGFGLRFRNIKGNSRGTLTVDYIYIGAESGLPTAHAYSAIVTEPTCTTQGYTTYTCAECGYSYISDYVEASHTEVIDQSVTPTCTETGLTEGSHCATCGEVIVAQTTVDALGHTEVIDEAVAPTCTETGLTQGSHCSVCGEVIVARGILDALGHSYKYADNCDKTHTVTCKNCDYSEITDCVFENGECICGAKEVIAPTYDDTQKFSHSLTLENDISINFIALGSALEGYDSFYLECKVPVYSGNELTGYEIVNIEPVYNGKNYEFTLLGVTAKMMNDDIEAVFRMTKDGKEYYSKTDVYSVAEYAYGKLNSTKASDTDELKAICANLLRYGALAQTQFNYRTDALVDAAMTEAHKSYLTDLNTVEMVDYRKQLNDLATPAVPWKSTTLELGNKVIMCLIVNLSNYTGDPSALTMHLTYTDSYGAVITEERPLELYSEENKTYAVSYDGLRATEMRSIVNAAIYNGDTRVSKTVEYSIESYGARSSDPAMQTLCLAMLAYGDAANTFFSK